MENKPSVKKVKTVKIAEDTKTFCDELSEELEYVYFGDTGSESDDRDIPNIDFVVFIVCKCFENVRGIFRTCSSIQGGDLWGKS